MGAPTEDPDSIWTPHQVDDGSPEAGDGSSSGGGRTARILIGVVFLLIAAAAVGLVVRGGSSSPKERSVGRALSLRPHLDGVVATSTDTAATTVTPTLVPTTVPPGAIVKCGDWDAAYNFEATEMSDGVYIWSDFTGWHVRAIGDGPGTVTGTITGTVQPNLLPVPDPTRVDAATVPGTNDLTFTVRPGTTAEGIDFSAGCTQKALHFALLTDGSPIDPKLVHLGRNGAIVATPFDANREPEPAG
ncbi:hypothetical protein [Aquihabitans sp. McL0605]|uniref:hypothetical protein n=1 Tax=Aquihabitans sp. McL0605 TaxID=3415671 RepID=UPI003CEBD85F